jgi:predicted alpha-1,6-mannanase (GH76 family)
LTNVSSGKLLHIANATPANGVNVDQNTADNNTVKWSIVDLGGGFYRLKSAANQNFSLDLSGGSDADGANVQLWSTADVDAQKWLFKKQAPQDAAPTARIADTIFAAWQDTFYYTNANGGYFRNKDNWFWQTVEMMEIVVDAYEVTGKARYKQMFAELYKGFIQKNGSDWMWNSFNDDIAWMVITCTRAALLTGNQTYLTQAKSQFDKMYQRAWSTSYGGGLLWYVGKTTKNACINGPGTVACMYLGQATGDSSYFKKAIDIYDWSKMYLFNRSTGKVNDSYDGTVGTWSSTYNQGTFLGAAVMLYDHTRDTTYLNDAIKIADFTKNTMFKSNVINGEGGGDDLPGFKGILMRYARRYTVDLNRTDLVSWLQLNAKVAYNNRNSRNLIGTQWGTRTLETEAHPWATSAAVSLLINCPLSTSLTRSAYETIEAEDFDYLKGVVVAKTNDIGSGEQIEAILNGHYTAYMNVDFGAEGAQSAEFRVSSATAGGTIEVRTGGVGGTLIGTAAVKGTGSWNTYNTVRAQITKTTGMQNIFLVYKGSDTLFTINSFKFGMENSLGSVTKISARTPSIAMNVNAAGTLVRIQLGDAVAERIAIANALGRTVFQSASPVSGTRVLDVSEFPRGMYFLTVQVQNRRIAKRMLLH